MHRHFIRTVLPLLALTAAAGAAQAETEFLYSCSDFAVVATYPESGTGRYEVDGVFIADLVPDGQGAWVDDAKEVQFWPEGEGPTLFLGSEQFTCEAFGDDPGMHAGVDPEANLDGGMPTTADLEMVPYNGVRGWEVYSMHSGGGFAGCAGSIEQPGGFLILQKKDYGWELRVPANQTEGFDGGVIVLDGKTVDAQFGFTPEGAGEAGLDDGFVARLRQGNRLTTQINGEEPINWDMKGSAAVVTKIEECYTRKGVLP